MEDYVATELCTTLPPSGTLDGVEHEGLAGTKEIVFLPVLIRTAHSCSLNN